MALHEVVWVARIELN